MVIACMHIFPSGFNDHTVNPHIDSSVPEHFARPVRMVQCLYFSSCNCIRSVCQYGSVKLRGYLIVLFIGLSGVRAIGDWHMLLINVCLFACVCCRSFALIPNRRSFSWRHMSYLTILSAIKPCSRLLRSITDTCLYRC